MPLVSPLLAIKGSLCALKTALYWRYTMLSLKVRAEKLAAMLILSLSSDYEPIQFVFPPVPETLLLPFSVGSTSPPTLCAVYSPLPLQSFRMIFKAGNTYVGGLDITYSTSGPLGEDLWIVSLVPNVGNDLIIESLDLYCRAKTAWETVTSEKYKVDFEESG